MDASLLNHSKPIVSDSAGTQLRRRVMLLSLAVGLLMLGGKTTAYMLTGSAAVLSDAAESVVHVVAVAFAVYSLALSERPSDRSHHYGYDKIGYFSAGFEGALIILAAIYIIFEAAHQWMAGLQPRRLDVGAMIISGATLINGLLGWYLIRVGRIQKSLILVADGQHVLTDSWTSLGVVAGLVLVKVTGWLPFDPIVAILVALNILWTGATLMREAFSGLMDAVDPGSEKIIENTLAEKMVEYELEYHSLRHRNAGNTIWIELHLLFPQDVALDYAHGVATDIEHALERALPIRTEVTTHLEPARAHDAAHHKL